MDGGPPLLEMRGISKTFPGVTALRDVDFDLRAGQVHALVGENGAGKSTLIKILSGVHRADRGTIRVFGETVYFASPRDAQRRGIATVYQEFNLVPQLTVDENLYLGDEPRGRWPGWVDRRRRLRDAGALLRSLGAQVPPQIRVRSLGVAEQQLVEIAKALSRDARIVVMDEPTAALTGHEIERLFAAIRGLTARGVGVIYISHRLEELREIGDRVTVLRDGQRIGTDEVGAVSTDEIIRMMVGREVREKYPKAAVPQGEEILRVAGLTRKGALHQVSFSLRRGEILGVAGLVGAGRTELALTLFGATPADGGTITVKGRTRRIGSPRDAIRAGIALLPEDRKRHGLILVQAVGTNITLPVAPRLVRWGLLDHARMRALARRFAAALRIVTPSLDRRVAYLSGGNQQKVVLAKWLAAQAEVVMFDEPTRGIDVGAKIEVYQLMTELVRQGAGVLMISSELPEILGMSDRILVMRRGRLTGEFPREAATAERVMTAALAG
ncbi:MAG TPA: sugar ABC transporter ATP-binding protein [bacterium]|nr:sugar ABC transporter ATP-binding protein [bacterium]